METRLGSTLTLDGSIVELKLRRVAEFSLVLINQMSLLKRYKRIYKWQ